MESMFELVWEVEEPVYWERVLLYEIFSMISRVEIMDSPIA